MIRHAQCRGADRSFRGHMIGLGSVATVVAVLAAGCGNVEAAGDGRVSEGPPEAGRTTTIEKGDAAYARQLANEACRVLEETYAEPNPIVEGKLPAFDAYLRLMTRLERPIALADKASGADGTWNPIRDYLALEMAFYERAARNHADGRFSKREKAEAEVFYDDNRLQLESLVEGLNRSCADAGHLLEVNAFGL